MIAMARHGKILKRLPPRRYAGGRSPEEMKYPWGVWLDGKPRRLIHGQEFDCSPKTLEKEFRRRAKGIGKKVEFRREVDDKGNVVSVAVQVS